MELRELKGGVRRAWCIAVAMEKISTTVMQTNLQYNASVAKYKLNLVIMGNGKAVVTKMYRFSFQCFMRHIQPSAGQVHESDATLILNSSQTVFALRAMSHIQALTVE